MRWLAVLLLVASPAAAQLSAVGTPVQVTPPTGVAPVRWPDVAYDPTDDVFLGISGATNIMGQYFTRAGQTSGAAFVVNADTALYAQAPRVAAGAARTFLVTWHASTNPGPRVRARLLQHGGAALTGDFDVSSAGSNHEMGAAIAWSPVSQVFLVAWQAVPGTLHAQRVSASGGLVGSAIDVDTAAPYARDPGVGYDPASDRFLVAYAGCVGNNDCFVRAQRVDAPDGTLGAAHLASGPKASKRIIKMAVGR